MPNTPVLVRCGATVLVCGNAVKTGDAELTRRLFSSLGSCDDVPEALLDAVTGVSGSGPAYVSVKKSNLIIMYQTPRVSLCVCRNPLT